MDRSTPTSPPPDETRRLIERAGDGDSAAVRLLIRRLLPVIHARVRRHLARSGRDLAGYDAHDLVQEVWLALLKDRARQLGQWDPERGATLEGFVGMVAERELGNLRQRATAQKRGAPVVALESAPEVAEPRPNPESSTVNRDTAVRLGTYLEESLSAKGQAVFRCLYTDDLAPDEAASALGVTRQVVYNWQHEIRRLARDFLGRAP